MADSIEEQIKEIQKERIKSQDEKETKVAFGTTSAGFDSELYVDRPADQYSKYVEETEEDGDETEDILQRRMRMKASSFFEENEKAGASYDPMAEIRKSNSKRIADKEDEYHARRRNRILSPDRKDAFGGDAGKNDNARSYSEIMLNQELDKEKLQVLRKIEEKRKDGSLNVSQTREEEVPSATLTRKRRWDVVAPATPAAVSTALEPPEKKIASEWDEPSSGSEAAVPTKKSSRWDQTPVSVSSSSEGKKKSRWDETPVALGAGGATPLVTSGATRSRWDETPVSNAPSAFGDATPVMTAAGHNAAILMTPVASHFQNMNPDQWSEYRLSRELDIRNRPWTLEELNSLLPEKGYTILEPPPNYVPVTTAARKLMATPTPYGAGAGGFAMGLSTSADGTLSMLPPGMEGLKPKDESLPFVKPEDFQHFSKLLVDEKPDEDLTFEEIREKKIMRLLLKIKNGSPPVRKVALRQLTERAREFGPGPLFDQILPLFMSPTLEEQERHLLVKVIDRILYKLDDLVRPYVHKILVVIEPLLIDEDYYARVEGREIICNLSKASGLASMIAAMRPDIDNPDEYVRNTTARAFSVVASALGIPAILPFLKAVCKSKKSWQARHTGIKIVQQIAILMGCAVLPQLKQLVDCIKDGLEDEEQKVRTISSLSIAALAEAAAPYGIESFDEVLKTLWKGVKIHRGKVLAAFLKATGYIVPLMDPEYAEDYTKNMMPTLIRQFQTPDEEMKKIVLKVVKQCVGTDGVTPAFVREAIIPDFFKYFWIRRMALDRRNYRQLVETTLEIALKVSGAEIITLIVDKLTDSSEQFRKMTIETIDLIVKQLGTADFDPRLEELLIDGVLYAFQEQTSDDVVLLDGFGTIINSLGIRVKPHLQKICSTILWRLNNKSAKVRQQAADVVARIASVMMVCGEEKLLGHLGIVLYEYLGEEYPEVLGSILAAIKSIVNVIGMNRMNPPIKDLLPRLTPILRNRHEKVQENCIDLVGRIADRGAEAVSAREWMRICFELLEMLKAHRKSIRRASVNTFGYIAKAIGPQDVLATLLNNLKVQERQMRVCTTVAIAIVAETCSPFTVLPALMNEYRVPEMNVQNGVLKSLSFLFEYIGEMAKDYVYAVAPLLEDALIDRDLVHRQTASTTVRHLALGVFGMGNEDVIIHLLNHVIPNIFETSPHMINAVLDAIEGCRVSAGVGVVLSYVLQGLFHPARRVREIYWKVYNNMHVGQCDSLTAYYPRIAADESNLFERYELDLTL